MTPISSIKEKALFIGGAPKSGTTLLMSLLEGHSRLVVFPEEVHFFDDFERRTRGQSREEKVRYVLQRTWVGHLAKTKEPGFSSEGSKENVFYEDFDEKKFLLSLNCQVAAETQNDAGLLQAFIRAYAETQNLSLENCERWVEKTPANIRHAGAIFKMFPRAKLINIVRDPRAVFASRRTIALQYHGQLHKAFRYLDEWIYSVLPHRDLVKNRESYLMLRYEELVQQTRESLDKICAFIGIVPEEANFQPTKGGKEWSGNSIFHESFQGVSAKSVDTWKDILSEEELWWVEFHCREGMAMMGYTPVLDVRKKSWSRFFRPLPRESLKGYAKSRVYSLYRRLT